MEYASEKQSFFTSKQFKIIIAAIAIVFFVGILIIVLRSRTSPPSQTKQETTTNNRDKRFQTGGPIPTQAPVSLDFQPTVLNSQVLSNFHATVIGDIVYKDAQKMIIAMHPEDAVVVSTDNQTEFKDSVQSGDSVQGTVIATISNDKVYLYGTHFEKYTIPPGMRESKDIHTMMRIDADIKGQISQIGVDSITVTQGVSNSTVFIAPPENLMTTLTSKSNQGVSESSKLTLDKLKVGDQIEGTVSIYTGRLGLNKDHILEPGDIVGSYLLVSQ